jgi:hypothetical protein
MLPRDIPVINLAYRLPSSHDISEVNRIATLETLLVPAVVVPVKVDITATFRAVLPNKSFCHP